MKVGLRTVILLALVVAIGSTAQAQQQKKKRQQGLRGPAANAFNLPETIELSAAQKEKIEGLKKEHRPKLMEITRKMNAIVTPEVRRARQQAGKAAREAGKKRQEVQAAIAAAGDLTDAQRKELAGIERELNELTGKIRQQVQALLTDEQRAQLRADRKSKAPGNKKKKKTDN